MEKWRRKTTKPSLPPPLLPTVPPGLTGCQSLSLGGGDFVDASLLVDKAALNHLEVQVACDLCDQQHADQVACTG